MCPSSTSSSSPRRAAAFALRGILFLIPLAAMFAPFEWLMWKSGESWSSAKAADECMRHPETLYMRGVLSQQFYRYKSEMIRRKAPKLVIVGSSRVWQFRDIMMHPVESTFYNGGGMLQNLADVESYVDEVVGGHLPKPDAVVVAIDGWWLKREPSEPGVNRAWKRMRERDESGEVMAHLDGVREMIRKGVVPWSLAFAGRPTRSDGRRPLGLAAFAGGGFRADGSTTAHLAVEEFRLTGRYRDRENPPIVDRVRGATAQFLATPGIDPSRVDRLIEALKRLRAAGVDVRTLLPPVSTECDAALRESAVLSAWWRDVMDGLPERLRSEGFVCVAVRSPADCGLDVRSMIDGFHASEVFVTYILERLIAGPGPWSRVDVDSLRALRKRDGVNPLTLGVP